jgi:hypothetical protein
MKTVAISAHNSLFCAAGIVFQHAEEVLYVSFSFCHTISKRDVLLCFVLRVTVAFAPSMQMQT